MSGVGLLDLPEACSQYSNITNKIESWIPGVQWHGVEQLSYLLRSAVRTFAEVARIKCFIDSHRRLAVHARASLAERHTDRVLGISISLPRSIT